VSAIIAAKGAIEADDEEASYAIGAILLLGAFSLFAFPAIGHALGMSDHLFGLWAGLAVDNTAEATAAGALYSDTAAKFAVVAKTTRNAMIGFVVLGYAVYWARKAKRQTVANKAAFLWQKFPKFVLGFLLISILATVGVFSKPQLTDLANLSRWAFLLTFAGVGLQTNFAELRKQGLRPLAGCGGRVRDCRHYAGLAARSQPGVRFLADSERYFRSQLHQPRRHGAHHLAERRAGDFTDHGGGSEELGMVEGVEGL